MSLIERRAESNPSLPQRDLIFDLGLHRGYDAEFYLSKGFQVVGLEAVPEICDSTCKRLAPFGTRFVPINKALSHRAGEMATSTAFPEKMIGEV
ncbi:hypothetical protein [Bradyrhizobium sp. BR 1432]|uniref:hypothetical protein n=1 Tax=Bradyrhizobium sp. BR 1432 TaxID=3447966 RepID=UPI003EE7EC21